MERQHRVVLNTVGSLGDLHPFIALALELKRLDVSAVIASFGEYREKVEAEGLEFRATEPDLPTVFRDLGMEEPEAIRHLIESDEFLFSDVLFPHIRAAYENALLIQSGAELVLTSSVAFGARIAAEKARIPWLAIVLQPLMFMSAYDPPMVPRPPWIGPVLRRLGPKVARAALNFSKATLLRSLTRPVREFRAELGLPNGRGDVIFDGQFSQAGAIGLYSPLLGPSQPDHPSPSEIVGFAYYDSESGGRSTLDPELERFLAAGTAPVVATLGSVAVNYSGAEAFYRDTLAAARKVGRRAVLLVGDRVDPIAAHRRGRRLSGAPVCPALFDFSAGCCRSAPGWCRYACAGDASRSPRVGGAVLWRPIRQRGSCLEARRGALDSFSALWSRYCGGGAGFATARLFELRERAREVASQVTQQHGRAAGGGVGAAIPGSWDDRQVSHCPWQEKGVWARQPLSQRSRRSSLSSRFRRTPVEGLHQHQVVFADRFQVHCVSERSVPMLGV